MSSAVLDRVRSEALELTEAERAELAHDLVASLDGPVDPTAAEASASAVMRSSFSGRLSASPNLPRRPSPEPKVTPRSLNVMQ
jgi:hypothetical protein